MRTKKDDILDHKPDSIFDVISKEFFKEDLGLPQHDEYLLSKNCYEVYYALAKYYQPKTILELGVRLGYSMIAMIEGSNEVNYVEGWDILQHKNKNYVDDCLNGLSDKINQYITKNDLQIELLYKNSQEQTEVGKHFDMIHIDAGHEHLEKLHDLKLTKNSCKVVVVDDYNCTVVGPSTNEFVRNNLEFIKDTIYINSMRGTLIIEYK